MRITPVIDLKDGQVVHARQGRRDEYRPISSPLCAGSDVFQIIEAFLAIYPFDNMYIADLNALQGNGNHDRLLAEVLRAYPHIDFWMDRGYVCAAEAQQRPGNYWPVLGSESLGDGDLPLIAEFGGHFVLSLDYFGDVPRGPLALFADPSYWPERNIIMTLGRVGAQQGPDFSLLESYCRNHPLKQFVAAGGVRDYADLLRLQALGIEQVLIASALHDGRLDAEDIKRIHTA